MHLIKLEVTNWRGLPAQIVEFDEEITVVGGPNESGKSSLRSALRAALLLPTGARGEKKSIEANRPWDTKLYPKVKLDLQLADKVCTVEKEFLKSKQWATLHYDGRLIAQDDDVQPKLMELMGAAYEWIDVLWGVQGELALDRAAPDSLKGRLASAAQETVLPQVAELQRLILDAYTEYWTEKRGSATKKLQQVRQDAIEAEKTVQELEEKLQNANRSVDELDASVRELDELRQKHATLQASWQSGQESLSAWETYARARSEADSAEASVKLLDQWLLSWQSSVQRVNTLVPDSVSWQRSVDELKASLGTPPSRTEVEELSARQKYLELSLQRDKYAEVEAISVPSAGDLKSLKEQEDALKEIDARLKAGEFRAVLTAEKSLSPILALDGQEGLKKSVAAGGTESWTAEQSFDLILPGVATIRVESGNPAIMQDIGRRSELQQDLSDLLEEWEASTVAELHDRARDKEANLRQLRKPESRALASARAAVQDADELDQLSIEEREDLLEEIPSELAVAELTWSKAQAAHAEQLSRYQELTMRNPVTELRTLIEGLRTMWGNAPFESDEKLEIPAGEVDDEWLEDLDLKTADAKAALDQRRAASEAARAAIVRPDGQEISKESLQQMQQQMQQLATEVQSLTALVNQNIGTIGAQGDLFSQLVNAKEKLARAQSLERKEEVEALAARELNQLFDSARQRLQKDVVAPLQELVSERFSLLTSGFYSGVAFDATLKLSGIATQSVSTIAIEDLSFGTREQLSLLTRLCLAELLSRSSGKQIVILDDNLVHTDNERMTTVCRLMEQAAKDVQIIVFTCHPERYADFDARNKVLIKGR